jgi:hypothetical protein
VRESSERREMLSRLEARLRVNAGRPTHSCRISRCIDPGSGRRSCVISRAAGRRQNATAFSPAAKSLARRHLIRSASGDA